METTVRVSSRQGNWASRTRGRTCHSGAETLSIKKTTMAVRAAKKGDRARTAWRPQRRPLRFSAREQGYQGEQAEHHRHDAQLKAHVVVGAGHAGAKAPLGRKELEELDKVAAPGVAPAVPLVHADETVLGHGRQRQRGR